MIPDKVRIGCFDYAVIETNEPIIVNNRNCRGGIFYKDNIIKIMQDQSEQQKELTFWHEVMHAIFDYREIDPEKNDEEEMTESIARGIYGMMKSNGLLPGQKDGDPHG